MKRSLITIASSVLVLSGLAFPVQAEDEVLDDVRTFKRAEQVLSIEPYSYTVYARSLHKISTLCGDAIIEHKDSVKLFKVNPSGANMAAVVKNKKGSNLSIYSLANADDCLFKWDTKKYGMPTSVAYTPDARTVVVAAGSNIYLLETKSKKYVPYATIENVPVSVSQMELSPNGYYLAAVGGSNCESVLIYNFEERTLRKRLDVGEKVNDIAFSPESSDFAVLTADGVLSLYSTRSYDLRKMVDELGEGLACCYNFDGKYMAVALSADNIGVINLLRDSDREYFANEDAGVTDVLFIKNADDNTWMAASRRADIAVRSMPRLKPYYNKLVNDEVDKKMDEWLKMMPGETMDQYRERVTDESRSAQRRLFEDEVSTNLAGNLLDGMGMSLGSYDRANGVLALNFDSMPTIYVPVSESDVTQIKSASDLSLTDVQYGIMPDDTFEIVYAKVTNSRDGKTYIYDNLQRAKLNYMDNEDAISLELLQQQQMEEIKLQEIRETVVEEAKSRNVISDNTNITVNSKVVPDYGANGNKILNYQVSFTYDVEPQFSAVEDFGPGKYHIDESGAATSMLSIVKKAFEGDLKQYIQKGKKLRMVLRGTADASPILHGIAYDGSYGEYEDEPVYKDGNLSTISVTKKSGITQNEQLAFVRALGVENYLEKNIEGFNDMNTSYRYEVNVSQDKGSEYRRINVDFIFVDAF